MATVDLGNKEDFIRLEFTAEQELEVLHAILAYQDVISKLQELDVRGEMKYTFTGRGNGQ